MTIAEPSNRRGREPELKARPLLVLPPVCHTGNQHTKNQNLKPFTQNLLQNPSNPLHHHIKPMDPNQKHPLYRTQLIVNRKCETPETSHLCFTLFRETVL